MWIRVDDHVEVIAGNDRGIRGRVLSIDRGAMRAVVEGVNRVYKHVRRSQKNPQGGRLQKEMPIHCSNLMVVCTACNRGVRVGARYLEDGRKVRHCKGCGAEIGPLGPARAGYAKELVQVRVVWMRRFLGEKASRYGASVTRKI